ncbi:MAG: T9SS type A sorting domain-containing protein [Ignavibacteria bacterium]|nr:T9SS type A sorting domain-containing protein [Ignavibacteria bacterium]
MKPYSKTLKSFILILFLISPITFIGKKYTDQDDRSLLIISTKNLNANNINTPYSNYGSFNRNPVSGNSGFEWPRGTNRFARYASGLWIGARVGNDTIVSYVDYISGFRPGYTDNNGNPQGENDPEYRVYKLILGINDSDRVNWPNILLGNSNQGAPVIFQNNSWRPLDFGHQTLFHRYTDSYAQQPLKVDVMQLDFAVDLPGGLADVIISQFTIINRSSNTWNDVYISFWTDDDIGTNFNKDKVGCDSSLGIGFTYKGENFDPSYGNFPPAVGFLILRGALRFTGNNNDTVYICRNKTRSFLVGYRDLGMNVFNSFINGQDSCSRDPLNKIHAYRAMSGHDVCGNPRVNPVGNYVTKYMYSGNPVSGQGWIQQNMGDQRFLISTGPINMNPGDTQVVVIAQLIAQGINNLFSINKLKELSDVVKFYYNSCYNNPVIGGIPISGKIPDEFRLHQNYPNPFNNTTKIKYELPYDSEISIIIYDLLGRTITSLIKNQFTKAGIYEITWNASELPSGVYIYCLKTKDVTDFKKMVLVK